VDYGQEDGKKGRGMKIQTNISNEFWKDTGVSA
jgi:hypothetical protein